MKLSFIINLWKGSTFFWIVLLMNYYKNFTPTAYTYLFLHGSYGFLWVCKSFIFPDVSFQHSVEFIGVITTSLYLSFYWIYPWVCIKNFVQLTSNELLLAQFIMTLGTFLHFCSDCQKYYTLRYVKKFIQVGFFSLIRNPNYLGELLIYGSFVYCTKSWKCLGLLLFNVLVGWVPRMYIKEWYLRKYPTYKVTKTKMFIPFIW